MESIFQLRQSSIQARCRRLADTSTFPCPADPYWDSPSINMGKQRALGVSRQSGKKFHYTLPKSQQLAQYPAPANDKNLANLFQDRRFGAQNPNMDDETKYLKRFTRERQNVSRRKGKFELDEEDAFVLTHKGEALDNIQDIDQFSDHSEASNLDEAAVEQLHFSGNAQETSKSAQTRYEEIIAKSKYNKYLHKKEKEDMQLLALDADKKLPELQGTLQFRDFAAERSLDEYDQLVNELKDEGRVRAAGEEGYEQALSAKQELEKLGETYEVAETYEEFVGRLGKKQGEMLSHFLTWNSPQLPSSQDHLPLLLAHLLRYLSQASCLPALLAHSQYLAVLSPAHQLCSQFPQTACELLAKLLESGLGGLQNVAIMLDLMGNLCPVEDLNDEVVMQMREIVGEILLKANTKVPERCCLVLFLAWIYAKKWLFPCHLLSPELFAYIRKVLVRTKAVSPSKGPLKDLILTPTYELARYFCEKLLISSFQAYKQAHFRPFFHTLVDCAASTAVSEAFSGLFEASGASEALQIAKTVEIPSFEPLIFDHITSLHKSKDPHKSQTDTDRLKIQVKSAKKEAKKALQRQSFASELRKQEESRLQRLVNERKGHKAMAALEDLQAEYKRTATSQDDSKKPKMKRRRMAGNQMEKV